MNDFTRQRFLSPIFFSFRFQSFAKWKIIKVSTCQFFLHQKIVKHWYYQYHHFYSNLSLIQSTNVREMSSYVWFGILVVSVLFLKINKMINFDIKIVFPPLIMTLGFWIPPLWPWGWSIFFFFAFYWTL
jgi:hypothetical protein